MDPLFKGKRFFVKKPKFTVTLYEVYNNKKVLIGHFKNREDAIRIMKTHIFVDTITNRKKSYEISSIKDVD